MCAYPFEEAEVVHVLLDGGADVCINSGLVTPVCYAAQRGYRVCRFCNIVKLNSINISVNNKIITYLSIKNKKWKKNWKIINNHQQTNKIIWKISKRHKLRYIKILFIHDEEKFQVRPLDVQVQLYITKRVGLNIIILIACMICRLYHTFIKICWSWKLDFWLFFYKIYTFLTNCVIKLDSSVALSKQMYWMPKL